MKHDSKKMESLFLSLTEEEKRKAIDYMLLLLSEKDAEDK